MPDHDTFLRAICDRPADDGPRLVYADWLEEHGDCDRSEFIRVQCELARTDPLRPPRPLLSRARELESRHRDDWLAPFRGLATACMFWRGFVEKIETDAGAFVRHADRLARLTPLQELELRGAAKCARDLFRTAALARMRKLDLSFNGLGDVGLGFLAECPHLGKLELLFLSANRLGSDDIAALLTAQMPRLRGLSLGHNELTAADAAALAGAWALRHLTWLNLEACGLEDDAAVRLARAAQWERLRVLNLRDNRFSPAGREALRERFGGVVMV